MTRINVYRPNKKEMIINKDKFKIIPEGYVCTTLDKDMYVESKLDYAFNILNWSNFADKKPYISHSDIDACASGDIILNIDETKEYYVCMSIGWKKFDNYSEMFDFMESNWNKPESFFNEIPRCDTHDD